MKLHATAGYNPQWSAYYVEAPGIGWHKCESESEADSLADLINKVLGAVTEQSPPPAAGLVEALTAAPILSKYHSQRGFEVERFITDYQAWSGTATAALTASAAPSGGVVEPVRVPFLQSKAWDARIIEGSQSAYSLEHCCYCGKRVRAASQRKQLTLTRTNDGDWWVVPPGTPVTTDTRDFGVFTLPIGPDCLEKHPEFNVGIAALSSAPAAQQDVNAELLGACRESEVILRGYIAKYGATSTGVPEAVLSQVQSAIANASKQAPAPQEALKSAQSLIDDALVYLPESLQPRASEVTKLIDAAIGGSPSQDAAGEGVRWFASLDTGAYYEVCGNKVTRFDAAHPNGTATALTAQTIEGAARSAAMGTGFHCDRELPEKEKDALRATWPPSPGVGA